MMSTHASTTTVTTVAAQPASTVAVKRPREEPPPALDDLLVALDVAPREETQEAVNTIEALVARAKEDGVAPHEYLVLALLIAFRRRNHAASQAEGMGAGERRLLRTILCAIAKHDRESVQLVVPLVPLYGCWRDLRLLAEELLADEPSATADGAPLPPRVDAICECFALQLEKDNGELEAEDKLPSSAAKYSPHEGRHQGKKSGDARSVNKVLADAIGRKLGLLSDGATDKHALRRRYRVVRAALNKKLAEKGFMLEPLLSARRLDAIQFAKAPKTALAKCQKAILKDAAAAARWKRAMAASAKAVPDITDLLQAAAEALEETSEPDAELRFAPRRLAKAVATAAEERAALRAKADEMLRALDGSADAAAAAEALREGATLPALPLILTSSARVALRAGEKADHSLLMAAWIGARAQGLPYVAVDGALVAVEEPAVVDITDGDAAPTDGDAAMSATDDDVAAAAAEAAEAKEPAEPSFDAFVARAPIGGRTARTPLFSSVEKSMEAVSCAKERGEGRGGQP